MGSIRGRRCRSFADEGAVAVEFVFIVPLLFTIFFATVQFGLAVHRTQMVEAAAREGARVASVGEDVGGIQARVVASAPGFLPEELRPPRGSIKVYTRAAVDEKWIETTTSGCTTRGHDIRVDVSAAGNRLDYEILFVDKYQPTYTASAVFRCEAT